MFFCTRHAAKTDHYHVNLLFTHRWDGAWGKHVDVCGKEESFAIGDEINSLVLMKLQHTQATCVETIGDLALVQTSNKSTE